MKDLLTRYCDAFRRWFWRNTLWIGTGLLVLYSVLLLINISDDAGARQWGSFTPTIWTLIVMEILPALVLFASVGSIIRSFRRIAAFRRREKSRSRSFRLSIFSIPQSMLIPFLASWMVTFWAIGWGLYVCALWSNYSCDGNVAEILGYAAMSSVDMFMLEINGNVLDNISGIPSVFIYPRLLKGCIVITAICAALCTFIMLINLFLSRYISTIHADTIRITPTRHNHLYIFWGVGEKEQMLAADIAANDKRHLIIYIDPEMRDSSDNSDGWSSILTHLTLNNPLAARVNQNENAMYIVCDGRLGDDGSDSWEALGLRRISALLRRLAVNVPRRASYDDDDMDNSLRVFFLSDDRDRNILEAKTFIRLLGETPNLSGISRTIYCANRREGVTSIIEDKYTDTANRLYVKVIDDSRLAIDCLRNDVSAHPVNFVEIDRETCPGAVSSPFCALIVGFGESGRDALRFLYEFGAFVDAKQLIGQDGKPGHTARSPFECHIVDPDIAALGTPFRDNAPDLFSDNKAVSDSTLIRMHACSDMSQEFYDLLAGIASRLNYVVVAAGDDEVNITIAVRILRTVRRLRGSLDRFAIFVRAYGKGRFSHMRGIVDYYNDLYGGPYLRIFGSSGEIYTYDAVIRDKAMAEAAEYHNRYSATEKGVSGQPEISYWDQLTARLDYSVYRQEMDMINASRIAAGQSPKPVFDRPEALMDIRRQIDENCKNSFHAPTKLHILAAVMGEDVLSQRFYRTLISLSHDWTKRYERVSGGMQPVSPKLRDLLINLSRLEHLRWVASHQLRGFTYAPSRDLIRKTHECMLDWEELDSWTQAYDYLVVETSISFINEE